MISMLERALMSSFDTFNVALLLYSPYLKFTKKRLKEFKIKSFRSLFRIFYLRLKENQHNSLEN